MPILLSKQEQEAIDEYKAADAAYNAAADKVDELFRLRYEPLLKAGNFEAVKEIISIMPDGIGRIYAADALRVARGDYKNKTTNTSYGPGEDDEGCFGEPGDM